MKETIVLWFNKVKNNLLGITNEVKPVEEVKSNSSSVDFTDFITACEQDTKAAPSNLKIWQILEKATGYLRQPEDIEAMKSAFICHAIAYSCNSCHPGDLAKHKEARGFVLKRLEGFPTLEDWLIAKDYVESDDVFETDEGFAKLQLTRKMWLLDMISECKAKDI